jgi:hypothetical protein
MECTAYCSQRNINIMLYKESFLNFIKEHVGSVIKECEHKLDARGQNFSREMEGWANLAIVGRHERSTLLASAITTDLTNFSPYFLDTLNDMQWHVEGMGNVFAIVSQCVGLVYDALL